jgi:ABC-2 family transporter protein
MFWEFFTFELKFRFKSISIYIYFLLWFTFSFLCVASESFGPTGNNNGKILLNGPYANIYNDIGISFFGLIVIAAIFGTSILRDFQRDTVQILFTKPISKVAYLGGRWGGSFVATVFAFSGLLFGEFFGTLAPRGDHTRIGPNHLSWYLQPFFSIVVCQIFFLGSLFFLVAALSRKIFIVYLQGAAIFMLYLMASMPLELRVRSSTSGPAFSTPSVFSTVTPSLATGPSSSATRSSSPGQRTPPPVSSSTTVCSGGRSDCSRLSPFGSFSQCRSKRLPPASAANKRLGRESKIS